MTIRDESGRPETMRERKKRLGEPIEPKPEYSVTMFISAEDGHVCIDWSEPIYFLALSPREARARALAILAAAEEAESEPRWVAV